jgi:hypothetical protein
MGEFKLNRKEKIAAFCKASGFALPSNFDISQPTFRFVAVDCSTSPPTVVNRSAFMASKVIKHITSSSNAGKSFRIFDFKRSVELRYPGAGNKLVKGEAFSWSAGVAA